MSAARPAGAPPGPRIIKKYPNRRLYDTEVSRYVTLLDLRQLVIDGVEFSVVDQQTQDDLTDSVLIHVIAELEATGEPMLPRGFLAELIRAYGGRMRDRVGEHLDRSLRQFIAEQRELRERAKQTKG